MRKVSARSIFEELRLILAKVAEQAEKDTGEDFDRPHGSDALALRFIDKDGRPSFIFACGLTNEGELSWAAFSTHEKDIGWLSAKIAAADRVDRICS